MIDFWVDKKVLAERLDGLNYVLDILQIAQKAIVVSQFLAIPSSKDWGTKKVAIYYPISYLVKSSENILFLFLHFIWLCGLWNHQNVLKNLVF